MICALALKRPSARPPEGPLTEMLPTRNARGRKPECRAAGSGDHCHLTANQIRRQARQAVILIFSPVIDDRDVLALNVAGEKDQADVAD
jgi:hypothetical protein